MSPLPRGPRGRLWQAWAYARDSYAFFTSCARRYGDPFLMKTLTADVLVTGRPDGIAEIFGADPASFAPFERDHLVPINGKDSIMVLTGDRLKQERKLLARPLSPLRVNAYGRQIRAAALRQAVRWPAGRPFSMLAAAHAISLEVLVRSFLGLDEPAALDAAAAAFCALRESLRLPTLAGRLWRGAGRAIGLGEAARRRRLARFERALAGIDDLVYAALAGRRGAAAAVSPDVLGELAASRYDDGTAPSDSDLRDQMVTLILAGRETTGTAIAWACHWLHRSPAVLARLGAELAAVGPDPEPEAVAALPYLGAVCNEVLRLHPTVADIPRRLQRNFSLLGHQLVAGQAVNACVVLAHRRQEAFPQPDRFRPERFLERSFSPFEFLPFGGGVRRCPGASLALLELKVVLAALLSRYRFRLAPDRSEPLTRQHTVMGPRGGVRMAVVETLRGGRGDHRD